MPNIFEQADLTRRAAIQITNNNTMAGMLLRTLSEMPDCREKSLAVTRLEECVMWANKCAARNM